MLKVIRFVTTLHFKYNQFVLYYPEKSNTILPISAFLNEKGRNQAEKKQVLRSVIINVNCASPRNSTHFINGWG